jgi:hypothetical protein
MQARAAGTVCICVLGVQQGIPWTNVEAMGHQPNPQFERTWAAAMALRSDVNSFSQSRAI